MKKISNREKLCIVLAVIFGLCSSLSVTGYLIFRGYLVEAAVNKNLVNLLFYITALICATFARGFFHGLYYNFFERFRTHRSKALRAGLFYSWLYASYEDFHKIDEGKKLSYYQQQVPSLNNIYYFSFYGMGQIITESLFCSISVLLINIKLGIVGIIFILLPSFIPQLFKKILDKKQSASLENFNAHIGKFSDWLKGFEVIKNYGAENKIQNLLDTSVDEVAEKNYSVSKTNVFSEFCSAFTSQLSVIVVIFYGIYMVYNNELSIAGFVMTGGLITELKSQVYYISMYLNRFIMSRVIFDGYNNVLIASPQENKIDITINTTDINFNEVSYRYADLPVLQNVNKKFTGNGITIIYGESGSGKTTAMKLLLGLLKPKTGVVTLDGKNIYAIKNRNEYISFLAQEAVFFDDTLKNNVTLGTDIEDEKIFTLMKKLGLEKFASAEMLNTGFTHIENKFSGGELKRLSFVRTLLRDTPVIIFDEPFANIDVQNIGRIEDIILELKNKKLFIVTHQLNDKIKEHAAAIWELPVRHNI
ncbi:ATP-binding cassette domain-containing protein [Treponema pedis]|uniref:ABC transporter ATP-binding protein n=1 Tax=Treponema pedis TaxID=409322 RepID=A0A7S6WP61_9SPIR|nr:ABC transporter ATP-binding protein [Treponema pedis]QOW60227.1 ABC transporter ATP-binding protein [Treponema pedis]